MNSLNDEIKACRSIQLYGLDIDKVTPAELIEKSNIINLSDDELICGFIECIEDIEKGYIDDAYYNAAPWAYEIYKRAYGEQKIDIRTLRDAVKYLPSSLRFWANEHIIRRVWTLLLKEGFNQRKKEVVNASA